MNVLPLLVLFFISIYDIAYHRISHKALLILVISFLISHSGECLTHFLLILLLSLPLLLFTDIGMGDIKLLLVLGLFAGESLFSFHYISIAWAITVMSLLFSMVCSSRHGGHIPIAPAISLPLIVIYLGF